VNATLVRTQLIWSAASLPFVPPPLNLLSVPFAILDFLRWLFFCLCEPTSASHNPSYLRLGGEDSNSGTFRNQSKPSTILQDGFEDADLESKSALEDDESKRSSSTQQWLSSRSKMLLVEDKPCIVSKQDREKHVKLDQLRRVATDHMDSEGDATQGDDVMWRKAVLHNFRIQERKIAELSAVAVITHGAMSHVMVPPTVRAPSALVRGFSAL
jgi:hypothetical protein